MARVAAGQTVAGSVGCHSHRSERERERKTRGKRRKQEEKEGEGRGREREQGRRGRSIAGIGGAISGGTSYRGPN